MATLAQMLKSKLKYNEAYEASQTVEEHQRIAHFRRIYDYYAFDMDRVLAHIKDAMGNTFSPETIASMQFPLYNLTKKIVDRLAVAYMLPAERYVVVPSAKRVDGETSTVIVDGRAKRDNDLYQSVLATSNINAAAKSWNRLAKLLDTVYVEVAYRDGKVEFDVLPPHAVIVRESSQNYLEPELVQYDKVIGGATHTIEWTATTHRILDKDGKMPEALNPWGGENRYGVIPLLPCRLSTPENHWGEGDTELVNITEKVNILIASMFYNGLMQSHSQAIAVNMNLDKQSKRVVTGPNAVIEVNNVMEGEVAPDFKFVSPDPATEANIKAIDWMIKQAAVMKGLSASSLSVDANEASGVSKIVDNAELMERRGDDVEFLRVFEKRLFDLTRTVWNTNESEQISDTAQFGIDFRTPEQAMSATDEITVKERKMALGLWSPVQDMIDEDEGIDEQQALSYVIQNMKWNRRIMQARENGST